MLHKKKIIPLSITLLFVFISLQSYSQTYINKSREKVKKSLETYVSNNAGFIPSITESDSAIVLSAKSLDSISVEYIYRFDKNGICNFEKVITTCDSCKTKYLTAALNYKQYQWKKINGNQYVSNYASKMLLEVSIKNNDYSFTIIRTSWSRQMYNLLKGQ